MPLEVSICMITYNHEKFIAKAIESVLAQKTNFSYELVIGEDSSPDRTREICLKYEALYPGRIKLLRHEKNLGAMGNFIQTVNECNGKYIAMLEGDDYWTDPKKLQLQVDFLESNSDFAICFHSAKVVHEDNSGKEDYLMKQENKDVFTIYDVIKDWFMATSSVVFRNNAAVIKRLPGWFGKMHCGDVPLWIMLSEHGKIKYLDRVMSVYRRNETGISNDFRNREKLYFKMFDLFKNLDEYFNFKYHRDIQKVYASLHFRIAEIRYQQNDLGEAKQYAKNSIKEQLKSLTPPPLPYWVLYLITHFPALYKSYKNTF